MQHYLSLSLSCPLSLSLLTSFLHSFFLLCQSVLDIFVFFYPTSCLDSLSLSFPLSPSPNLYLFFSISLPLFFLCVSLSFSLSLSPTLSPLSPISLFLSFFLSISVYLCLSLSLCLYSSYAYSLPPSLPFHTSTLIHVKKFFISRKSGNSISDKIVYNLLLKKRCSA